MFELVIILIVVVCFAFVCFLGSPFLPTRKKWIEEAFSLVELGNNDMVIDLGSGNGKVLRLLSKKGIKSVGYEINPLLVVLSKITIIKDSFASVKMKNYWVVDLPKDATVVYAFMVDRDAGKLEDYIQQQAKTSAHNIKLITFGFSLPSTRPIKKYRGSCLYMFE